MSRPAKFGQPSPAVSAAPAPAVDPRAARQAAQWLVRLHAGEMTEADHAACVRWRAADPANELAWQRAELVSAKLGLLPAGIAAPTLRRAALANRRAAIRSLSMLIVAGPAALLAWHGTPWQQWVADERTATGERRTLLLPDGSQLTLNTASAVDLVFDDGARRVILRAGEILVQTAPDPAPIARPFIVACRHGAIRALGTRFLVRQGQERSRAAVVDGAVEITPRANAAGRLILPAGWQSSFSEVAVDAAQAIDPLAEAWASGTLYAEKMPLREFIAEVSRYRPGILRCDPAVAALRVSGAFQSGNTDAVLRALAESLPVKVTMRTRYWVNVGPA